MFGGEHHVISSITLLPRRKVTEDREGFVLCVVLACAPSVGPSLGVCASEW